MYKVFVNDKPIILTDSLKNNNTYPVYIFKEVVIDEILHKLKTGNTKGANLFCANLPEDLKAFKKHFKVVHAGGGLVLNSEKEILFIYRNGIWDLPKGRVEKGESIEETSIREVEEECGVSGLQIVQPLLRTHHIFFLDQKQQLKITDWFLMDIDFNGKLAPQLEEGITEVVFKNKEATAKVMKHTYANIKLVIDAYYQM